MTVKREERVSYRMTPKRTVMCRDSRFSNDTDGVTHGHAELFVRTEAST